MEEQMIEQMMEFKYLGVTLSGYGRLKKELEEHVNRANRATGCLNDVIWKNRNIGKEMK